MPQFPAPARSPAPCRGLEPRTSRVLMKFQTRQYNTSTLDNPPGYKKATGVGAKSPTMRRLATHPRRIHII